MIKKILIAVDSNDTSFFVVEKGISLAQQLDTKIGLIDVTNLSIGNIDGGVLPIDVEKANQQRAVIAIKQIKYLYPNIQFDEFEPIGKPAEEILKVVKAWKADMLIIGNHKHSVLYKVFRDSVEQKLSEKIEIPLLLIPE